jgi:hypothetical protein
MKIKRYALITVVSLLTTLIGTPSFAVDKNKYLWPQEMNTKSQLQGPHLGYYVTIADDFTQGPGAMEANSFISVAGNMQPICSGFDDPVCVEEIKAGRGNWWSNIAFAPCKSANQLSACIEAVRIKNSDNTYRNLIFKKVIPGNYWPANLAIGLPEGSAPSLWVDPKETNQSKGYLVAATSALSANTNDTTVKNVSLTSFQSSISPYETIAEAGITGLGVTTINGVKRFSGSFGPHCIWADTGECGVQTEFAPGTRLQLVLHLPTQISSWLLGRMRDPEVSVESLSKNPDPSKDISRVTISADSIEIPMIAAKVDLADMSDAQRTYFNNPNNNKGKPDFPNNLKGYDGVGVASSYDIAFEMYELFKKQWPKNAQLMFPRWSVRSLMASTFEFNQCAYSAPAKFQGFVTTNASIYQGAPPTFDGDTFNYKVAGVHNKTNGEVFQGSYDLVLDSKFARCLYKFSAAPIKASVSITNADGNSSVATSTFTEKDGWMKLSVNGFTFSAPNITVKLSQDKVVIAPMPTPSPTPKVDIKPIPSQKTITCVKGKQTKKVTAISPKCPVGYKKK